MSLQEHGLELYLIPFVELFEFADIFDIRIVRDDEAQPFVIAVGVAFLYHALLPPFPFRFLRSRVRLGFLGFIIIVARMFYVGLIGTLALARVQPSGFASSLARVFLLGVFTSSARIGKIWFLRHFGSLDGARVLLSQWLALEFWGS
jgi:hypothetical protein